MFTKLTVSNNAFVDLEQVSKFLEGYSESKDNSHKITNLIKIGTTKRVAYFYLFFLYMFKNDIPSGLFDQANGGENNIPPYILKQDRYGTNNCIILNGITIELSNPSSDSESIVDFLYPVQILQQSKAQNEDLFGEVLKKLFNQPVDNLIQFIKDNFENKSFTNEDDKNTFKKSGDLSTILTKSTSEQLPFQPGNTWLDLALKTAELKEEVTRLEGLVSASKP